MNERKHLHFPVTRRETQAHLIRRIDLENAAKNELGQMPHAYTLRHMALTAVRKTITMPDGQPVWRTVPRVPMEVLSVEREGDYSEPHLGWRIGQRNAWADFYLDTHAELLCGDLVRNPDPRDKIATRALDPSLRALSNNDLEHMEQAEYERLQRMLEGFNPHRHA